VIKVSPHLVYKVKINNLQCLEARKRDAVATVTHNILRNTWTDVEYRLDMCRATRKAHNEIH